MNVLPFLNRTLLVFTAATAWCGFATAQAAIVEWDLSNYRDGVPPSASYASAAPGASASAFTFTGRNGGADGNTEYLAAIGYNATFTEDTETLGYTSFTVSPDPGNELVLESLGHSAFRPSPSLGARTGMWGYRIDDGSGFGDWTYQNGGSGFTLPTSPATALSIWDFDDFSTTGTVEVAFWAWNWTVYPGYTVVVDSFVDSPGLIVNGSVTAVPEPASIVMAGLGGVAALAIAARRRRK